MLSFRKSPLLAVLFVAGSFFFTACDEDNLREQTLVNVSLEETLADQLEASLAPPPEDPDDPAASPAERTPCFRFAYPISFVQRGGEVTEVASPAELREFIGELRAERRLANFVYPFNVVLANDETVTINRYLEFRRLRNFCAGRDNVFDEPCFRYNYPLEVNINDRTLTVNGPRAWRVALRAAARGADVGIAYPISVTTTDGETLTLEDRQAHNELRRACANDAINEVACFRFVYPLDLSVGETTETVNSPMEWRQLVIASGMDTQIRPAYPVDITLTETAETITVTAASGWAEVRELCQ